jgi:hypothetical protein
MALPSSTIHFCLYIVLEEGYGSPESFTTSAGGNRENAGNLAKTWIIYTPGQIAMLCPIPLGSELPKISIDNLNNENHSLAEGPAIYPYSCLPLYGVASIRVANPKVLEN